MKIENNSIHSLTSQKAQATPPAERNTHAAEHTTTSQGKDRAELSDQARMLAKARNALHETPDVRNERIERLREQLLSGTYAVPYDELARRLLQRLK